MPAGVHVQRDEDRRGRREEQQRQDEPHAPRTGQHAPHDSHGPVERQNREDDEGLRPGEAGQAGQRTPPRRAGLEGAEVRDERRRHEGRVERHLHSREAAPRHLRRQRKRQSREETGAARSRQPLGERRGEHRGHDRQHRAEDLRAEDRVPSKPSRRGQDDRPERRRRSGDRNARVVGKAVACAEVPRKLQVNPGIVEREPGERLRPFDVREVQRRADGGGCDHEPVNEAGNPAESDHGFSINAARSWPSAVSATSNTRITRHPG